jgi:ribosome-associated protein
LQFKAKDRSLIISRDWSRVDLQKNQENQEVMVEITRNIRIPEEELTFRASRSSGPGGQNVNKLNTRITLFFDVAANHILSDQQKQRIFTRLSTRIDKDGILQVASQKFRTQKANRDAAVERFQNLLAEALKTKPLRKKTKVPYAARQKRLDEKRKRSRLKRQRTEKPIPE